MVTGGNRETNLVAMVAAVKANREKPLFDSSITYHMLSNIEKEKLVIDLYYNQHKNVRQIAQEARMSFRDIATILKKQEAAANASDNGGNGNGTVVVDNQQQGSSKSQSRYNEKATQAYNLFSEGKKPIEVAIQLNLREKQVNKLFREFWRLKNLNELYEIYLQIEHCLPSFLKLHKALKKKGLNPKNADEFADAIEIGVVKLPELQGQYQNLQDKV